MLSHEKMRKAGAQVFIGKIRMKKGKNEVLTLREVFREFEVVICGEAW